jgi:hypothetical protein
MSNIALLFGALPLPEHILKNLVQSLLYAILLAAMNRKQYFWLLALIVAVLFLNSCASEEGVAPAEGELDRSHGGINPGY